MPRKSRLVDARPHFTEDPKDFSLAFLRQIVETRPSDRLLDHTIIKGIEKFLKTDDFTPATVWNFYKRTLDVIVHTSGAAPMFIVMFDLEECFLAPPGGYADFDSSIDKAPWRNGGELWPTD